VITAHALIMIFFTVMPGDDRRFRQTVRAADDRAPAMAFPRMNNISFWLLVRPSGLLLGSALSMAAPGPAGALSRRYRRQQGIAVRYGDLLHDLAARRRSWDAINFITTIFNMRAPGMTLTAMPLFVWSVLVTASCAALAPVFRRRHHHAG